jgi:uncharacterized protein YndB with AHSA1/START domain
MMRNLSVAKGATVEVTREVVLPAEPEQVWEALTDPERLGEWFANDVELDARPGGEGVFRWDDGDVRVAHVEEVVPGERLGFRWSDGDGAESTVTIELEDVDGGTRLRVVETPSAVAGEWATGRAVNALFAAAAAVR